MLVIAGMGLFLCRKIACAFDTVIRWKMFSVYGIMKKGYTIADDVTTGDFLCAGGIL